MIRRYLERLVREEIDRQEQVERANPIFHTLTIHFAEGSDIPAVSIPVDRWNPRTSVNLPLKVVRDE